MPRHKAHADIPRETCPQPDDRLYGELLQAFRKHGVHDAWLVQQLAHHIRERFKPASEHHEAQEARLVAEFLTASGYSDVAATFVRQRGRNPLQDSFEQLSPWDAERLHKVIANGLPLTASQLADLLPQCEQALRSWSLTHVSDDFILQLALQLAFRQHTSPMPSPSVSPLVEEHLAHGVLRLVTAAPAPVLELDMGAFLHHFLQDWYSELALSARLPQTAQAIAELLAAQPRDTTAPPCLNVCGLEKLSLPAASGKGRHKSSAPDLRDLQLLFAKLLLQYNASPLVLNFPQTPGATPPLNSRL